MGLVVVARLEPVLHTGSEDVDSSAWSPQWRTTAPPAGCDQRMRLRAVPLHGGCGSV